ncbi:hypothetical protein F542_4190 [Bibersteinia trehalosi USDA-ARS-USMARC-188]|uniref:Uncharacterized protein n=2 Tax=Bibersteinia trehalosi TaxID=47735 RepID=W0R9Q6_BIBTR|nr:hypothetical protein F542_4190 [Bibersteinia trehalosi USDA-ARS-USMARC-188]AHG87045.1 hypothetical protein F544_18170 [Bibersteinia trehalosi USDA-ARS-USMARC-190]
MNNQTVRIKTKIPYKSKNFPRQALVFSKNFANVLMKIRI